MSLTNLFAIGKETTRTMVMMIIRLAQSMMRRDLRDSKRALIGSHDHHSAHDGRKAVQGALSIPTRE
jgi:hypothetical protein